MFTSVLNASQQIIEFPSDAMRKTVTDKFQVYKLL